MSLNDIDTLLQKYIEKCVERVLANREEAGKFKPSAKSEEIVDPLVNIMKDTKEIKNEKVHSTRVHATDGGHYNPFEDQPKLNPKSTLLNTESSQTKVKGKHGKIADPEIAKRDHKIILALKDEKRSFESIAFEFKVDLSIVNNVYYKALKAGNLKKRERNAEKTHNTQKPTKPASGPTPVPPSSSNSPAIKPGEKDLSQIKHYPGKAFDISTIKEQIENGEIPIHPVETPTQTLETKEEPVVKENAFFNKEQMAKEAISLKLSGNNFNEIGEMLKISPKYAKSLIEQYATENQKAAFSHRRGLRNEQGVPEGQ